MFVIKDVILSHSIKFTVKIEEFQNNNLISAINHSLDDSFLDFSYFILKDILVMFSRFIL